MQRPTKPICPDEKFMSRNFIHIQKSLRKIEQKQQIARGQIGEANS